MKQILQNQKDKVKKVFDNVYDKYDLMNDFMSLGIHRMWKKDLVMMMCPSLNKKLIEYEKELEKTKILLYNISGAIQAIKNLERREQSKETTRMN